MCILDTNRKRCRWRLFMQKSLKVWWPRHVCCCMWRWSTLFCYQSQWVWFEVWHFFPKWTNKPRSNCNWVLRSQERIKGQSQFLLFQRGVTNLAWFWRLLFFKFWCLLSKKSGPLRCTGIPCLFWCYTLFVERRCVDTALKCTFDGPIG